MNPSDEYDELVVSLTKRSKPRPKQRGRKKEIEFVCKKSIDFTADMWLIIQERINQTHGNPRTVVYEGLRLLAEKQNIDL